MVRFFLIYGTFMVSMVSAQAQVIEGFIIDIRASERADRSPIATVQRGDGVSIPATPLMFLEEGDLVEVADGETLILVESIGGRIMELRGIDSPFPVQGAVGGSAGSPIMDDILMDDISQLIQWNSRRQVELITRTYEAPYLRVFDRRGAKVGILEHEFLVLWSSSRPPYSVIITVGDVEISRAEIASNSMVLPIEAELGDIIDIAVVDSNGTIATADVSVDVVPTIPVALGENLPSRLAVVVEAAWLASQDNHTWMPEALQHLLPLLGDYPPADQLAALMSMGIVP